MPSPIELDGAVIKGRYVAQLTASLEADCY